MAVEPQPSELDPTTTASNARIALKRDSRGPAGPATAVDGGVAYFKGAIVAYANDVKMTRAGVPEELIALHGETRNGDVVAWVVLAEIVGAGSGAEP